MEIIKPGFCAAESAMADGAVGAESPDERTSRHGRGRVSFQFVISALTALLLGAGICQAQPHTAQKRWTPQTGFGRYESDSSGNLKQFNYALELDPIDDWGFMFHDLANQNLIIYNFSAGCHRCQNSAPYIHKLSDTLSAYGFILVGIAVSRNRKSDIKRLVKDHKLEMILFQDKKRGFAKQYGMDTLPIVMLVGKNGAYMRGMAVNIQSVYNQILKAVFEKELFP